MGIKCILGFHNWNGCQCCECGKQRDEGHDRKLDCEKCAKCGKIIHDMHNWRNDCEKCSTCGKTRVISHVWDGCSCRNCGVSRDEQHDWSKDCEKCKKCGKTRENQHEWNVDSDNCKICNISRQKYLKRKLYTDLHSNKTIGLDLETKSSKKLMNKDEIIEKAMLSFTIKNVSGKQIKLTPGFITNTGLISLKGAE